MNRQAGNDNGDEDLQGLASCADCLWTLGYESGEAGDHASAVFIFELLVRAGDVSACLSLANVCTAELIPRDDARAIRLLKKAVRLGSATAAWNLAMGHRLCGSRRWYVHWLKVADRLGEEDATEALGRLAERGAAWWRLDDVSDPPNAAIGFRSNVTLLE